MPVKHSTPPTQKKIHSNKYKTRLSYTINTLKSEIYFWCIDSFSLKFTILYLKYLRIMKFFYLSFITLILVTSTFHSLYQQKNKINTSKNSNDYYMPI